MELRIFNSLGRAEQVFTPRSPEQVGLYTCGPTVYSFAHIGNLRTYVFEDILKRVLMLNGYSVNHVMNVTDVGHLTGDGDSGQDKMELSAKAQQKSAWEIAQEYTDAFFADLKALNIIPATHILYATKTIDWQIELIKKLENNGFTYRTSDGIYFDIQKFPRYGQLSGQSLEEKKAGARVEENAEKHHPSDFALWKFSQPDEHRQMEWPSPWGVGFPGWHIECSAMAMHELGEQFDIHCGGIDHVAVHHENEIAQSEAATGVSPFVQYWMHGEFLVLPDARMGKSEGNAILLSSLHERSIHPLAYRYLLLQSHYRSPLSFTWTSLEAAQRGLQQLWRTIDTLGALATEPVVPTEDRDLLAAFNSDLNTAKALGLLSNLLQSNDIPAARKLGIARWADHVLGLGLTPDSPLRPHLITGDIPADVQTLIDQRAAARLEKNWAESDRLRQAIERAGFQVNDTPSGSSYTSTMLK
jgi:cysteinyl-tRNA synthetase